MSARADVLASRQHERASRTPASGAVLDTEHWPPAPHDPRERELAMALGGWEVRIFTGRKFQYFVTRGLWHVQLWHPRARISILTPSRLTCGRYEAYPIADWKGQATDYEGIAARVAETHKVALVAPGEVLRVERALVDDVVRSKDRLVS